MSRQVVTTIPVTDTWGIAVVSQGFREWGSYYYMRCRRHGEEVLDCEAVSALMGDRESVIAKVALAAVSRDWNEYFGFRRLAPGERGLHSIVGKGKNEYIAAKELFAEYLRAILREGPVSLLRALGAMGDYDGPAEDPATWLVFRRDESGKVDVWDRVRIGGCIDLFIAIDRVSWHITVPCILSMSVSCHEFGVVRRVADDEAWREVQAIRPGRVLGGPWVQMVVSAVARGVLRVVERVDEVLLS